MDHGDVESLPSEANAVRVAQLVDKASIVYQRRSALHLVMSKPDASRPRILCAKHGGLALVGIIFSVSVGISMVAPGFCTI
jgi:hypothetical protein